MTMTVELRALEPDELPEFAEAFANALGLELSPRHLERMAAYMDLRRLRVGVDHGQVVATFGAHRLPLTVPGAVVPMAGTTVVTVLPTHRRRGLLRRLMMDHLRELKQEGIPLAGLWASEGSIYGRFGFGVATERIRWRIPKSAARLASPVDLHDHARWLHVEDAHSVLSVLYDEIRQQRVGLFERRKEWWENRLLADPPMSAAGVSQQRRVIYAPQDKPMAYALYRTRRADLDHGLDVLVQEVMGVTPEAEKALWQFLFSIDLVESFDFWNLPADHPIRWWIHDIRKVQRQAYDGLWLRLVDVPRALEARRYSMTGVLTIRVEDVSCPWNAGSWRLDVQDDGSASCRLQSVGSEADLVCSVESLGSAYLGGVRWSELASAGRVSGSESAVLRADRLFEHHRLPWCAERF